MRSSARKYIFFASNIAMRASVYYEKKFFKIEKSSATKAKVIRYRAIYEAHMTAGLKNWDLMDCMYLLYESITILECIYKELELSFISKMDISLCFEIDTIKDALKKANYAYFQLAKQKRRVNHDWGPLSQS